MKKQFYFTRNRDVLLRAVNSNITKRGKQDIRKYHAQSQNTPYKYGGVQSLEVLLALHFGYPCSLCQNQFPNCCIPDQIMKRVGFHISLSEINLKAICDFVKFHQDYCNDELKTSVHH